MGYPRPSLANQNWQLAATPGCTWSDNTPRLLQQSLWGPLGQTQTFTLKFNDKVCVWSRCRRLQCRCTRRVSDALLRTSPPPYAWPTWAPCGKHVRVSSFSHTNNDWCCLIPKITANAEDANCSGPLTSFALTMNGRLYVERLTLQRRLIPANPTAPSTT